jgi:hypothetical protein
MSFVSDTRAVEGLPVRLVIAFVVGVATLSVMLNMVSGVESLVVRELDVQPAPDVIEPGEQTVVVSAVDSEGASVAGATVIVTSETARIDGPVVAKTNESGVAALTLAPELAANQADGTLSVRVKPPAGSNYEDRRENTAILVVDA